MSESLKPYRVTVVHQLQEPDKDKQLNYCRWFQTFIVQNPAILSITWFMVPFIRLCDDRIISRNLWPPRSPDLTTPDFFLWGYLKDRVYATRPQTLDDLKHNITQEIQAIDNRVLQRVASNMERRVELCLMQDGGHFQHLL